MRVIHTLQHQAAPSAYPQSGFDQQGCSELCNQWPLSLCLRDLNMDVIVPLTKALVSSSPAIAYTKVSQTNHQVKMLIGHQIL